MTAREVLIDIKASITYCREEFSGFSFVDSKNRLYFLKNKSVYFLLKTIMSAKSKEELNAIAIVVEQRNWIEILSEILEKIRSSDSFDNNHILMYPITMSLNITNKCNLKCKHCYEDTFNGRDMSYDMAMSIALQARELGIFVVVLTGGEPTLNPNWKNIARIFSENGLRVILNTNAINLTMQDILSLQSYGIQHVHLSVDGNEKIHNSIRGVNSYNLISQTAKCLQNNGIDVELLFTANKLNYFCVKDVVQLATDLGCKVKIKRMIPTQFESHNQILLNEHETKEVVTSAKELNVDGRVSLDSCFDLKYGLTDYSKCMFLSNQITTVDVNGNVFVCPYLRQPSFSLGNIQEHSLKEIWEKYLSEPRYMFTQEQLSGKCQRCTLYEDCSGGCRAWAYYIEKDFYASDGACYINRED